MNNPNGNNQHPRQKWEVIATFPDTKMEATTRETHVKRDACRSYDMLVKFSQEPTGKYSGASVRLCCDGETVSEYKAIT